MYFDEEDRQPPRQHHSGTSNAAAEAVKPRAATLREKVLAHIQQRGIVGATDEEIQDALAMDPNTARPRRIECVKAGWVRDSGMKRKTRSEREATVWCSTGSV